MSRALRYTPPLGNRGLIVRPRLLARLRTRFDRRLTAVVAPAGFGKTTLLAQAVQENALSPLCEDRWLTCQRDDTALSFLAAGAFAAVGISAPVPEDPGDAALTVAEAIWSAAPHHVALFLDDAHLVEAASPGGRFLTGLVEELPRNGHVVIASRPPLPLRASRLVANGDAVVVGERELHFRDDEMAAFAASRHVPRELLEDVGGWPALAELTATAGAHAVSGYVWEELLSRLSPERRHALAVLVAVGGADDDLVAALLGELRLLEHLSEIREPDRLPGWLRTTAQRVCLAMLRESRREAPIESCEEATVDLRWPVAEEAGPEECAVRRDHQVLVRRAVATLPERHQALLGLLVSSTPISYQEISAGLGMPVGSIGPTRARILARLRLELETAGLYDTALN